jgi:hypothetical protein
MMLAYCMGHVWMLSTMMNHLADVEMMVKSYTWVILYFLRYIFYYLKTGKILQTAIIKNIFAAFYK